MSTTSTFKKPKKKTKKPAALNPYSPAEVENAVIYEANIRQYSKDGDFASFTKDIPKLKKLGVKILWIMPVQPISLKRRKTTDGRFIEEIKSEEEKEKYLGSYYSLADYTAVNPDFGTLEDFKKLVKTAHKNGMYVLLDWVANHTGWDHKWIEEHPEFYHKNQEGEVTEPLNPWTGQSEGWGDVAHLNYHEGSLFEAMKNEMLFWVKEADIDGFRCDVAERVRLEFWQFAIPELRKEKPLFMMMEADNPDYLHGVFDMAYNWKSFHVMNEIAQGRQNVSSLDGLMDYFNQTYQKEDILMNFTSNHDENSWNGSEYERLGEAVEVFAALTYLVPGMPLIYTGQEYDVKERIKFFEKDLISKRRRKMFSVYEKLGKLKNENPALHGGVNKASYERVHTSDDTNLYAFKREKDGKQVYFIANLLNSYRSVQLPIEGDFTDYMHDKEISLTAGEKIDFAPWEYLILMGDM